MSNDEFDSLYAERITSHVTDYINASRIDFDYANKPMNLEERRTCMNTINKYRDVFMFDREIFRNFLGAKIYETYSKAFDDLFKGGKQQACYENAIQMKAKGYPLNDIVEITGLTYETVGSL